MATPSVGSRTKAMLAAQIQKKEAEICEWYRAIASTAPPPFYCSIDLRDAGVKIAPVDSNLYPAGFNNICPEDQRTAPAVVQAWIEAHHPRAKKLLVIPEAHTTNGYYLENLHFLRELLVNAGLTVQLGWWGETPGSADTFELKSATEKPLNFSRTEIQDGVIRAGAFTPDLVLLNNDFSSGYPSALDAVKQPIIPTHRLGWHSRKKSRHFEHYNRLAAEFARIIDIEPWMIQVDTVEVADVNFNEDQGIDRVADAVDAMIARTKTAYEKHGFKRAPFVFVKNNSGTYGMGIMVVRSGEELRTMNRRSKNKMSVGKNKLPIQSVAIQEGVPTATLVDRLASEPVIYLNGCELIGGFLRTNTEKGDEENLNSQGMVFRKLCMSDLRTLGEEDASAELPIFELVYGTIARISALATGLEIAELGRR